MLVDDALNVRTVATEDQSYLCIIHMQHLAAVQHEVDHNVPIRALHIIHMFR